MNAQTSFLRLATRSFWLWFGGIWLLVGVPFFFVGLILIRGEWAYQTEGSVIQGIVLSKDMRRATKDQSTSFRGLCRKFSFESIWGMISLWNRSS